MAFCGNGSGYHRGQENVKIRAKNDQLYFDILRKSSKIQEYFWQTQINQRTHGPTNHPNI
jgi:hypothetical protein